MLTDLNMISPGNTNETSDQTASVAIKNTQAAVVKKCKRIEAVVSQLHPTERLVIENRYMRKYVRTSRYTPLFLTHQFQEKHIGNYVGMRSEESVWH